VTLISSLAASTKAVYLFPITAVTQKGTLLGLPKCTNLGAPNPSQVEMSWGDGTLTKIPYLRIEWPEIGRLGMGPLDG
jgi:hypothetical protein